MKAVLISIQPKWCELIASGKKRIEVRKTRPKIETPFKCYIYCTKGKSNLISVLKDGDVDYCGEVYHGKTLFIKCPQFFWNKKCENICGKVIGEFVCDGIYNIEPHDDGYGVNQYTFFGADYDDCKTGLSFEELKEYLGGNIGYAWHISDLKIYDKPKELGEFRKPCDFTYDCCVCKRAVYKQLAAGEMIFNGCNDKITRPPQSWQFVEQLE